MFLPKSYFQLSTFENFKSRSKSALVAGSKAFSLEVIELEPRAEASVTICS